MVIESIAAVTAGLSAINSLFSQAREAQGNLQGVMNGLTSFQDGLQRYEIEKRASLVAPLTPQEALKVAMAKQQVDRYNTELHNMCIMSRDGQKLWDDYQQALADSKERHKAQVKAIIQANKPHKSEHTVVPHPFHDLVTSAAEAPIHRRRVVRVPSLHGFIGIKTSRRHDTRHEHCAALESDDDLERHRDEKQERQPYGRRDPPSPSNSPPFCVLHGLHRLLVLAMRL